MMQNPGQRVPRERDPVLAVLAVKQEIACVKTAQSLDSLPQR